MCVSAQVHVGMLHGLIVHMERRNSPSDHSTIPICEECFIGLETTKKCELLQR